MFNDIFFECVLQKQYKYGRNYREFLINCSFHIFTSMIVMNGMEFFEKFQFY